MKKASQFSLGMKQRLAIAVALLHNPSLLILDEPTNGLDPSGIVEMRALLKKLNKEQGITILISSHLLTEIEKLVTDIGIINNGTMLFQGSLKGLINHQKKASSLIFITNNNDVALKTMFNNHLNPILIGDNKIKLPIISKDLIAEINRQLVAQNIDVYGISTVENDLETIFMDLINN